MKFWYNRWTLTGRLVKDPDPLRYLPSGQPQIEFTIANNRPISAKGATSQTEQVSFFEIVARGRTAEVCSEHLRKGSPVFIEGEAAQMAYPTSNTTAPPKKRVVLRARNVYFLAAGVEMPAAEEPSGVEIPE